MAALEPSKEKPSLWIVVHGR